LVTLIFAMEIGPYLESVCWLGRGNEAVPVRPYSTAVTGVEGEWLCKAALLGALRTGPFSGPVGRLWPG
jgi:hypothetical protein